MLLYRHVGTHRRSHHARHGCKLELAWPAAPRSRHPPLEDVCAWPRTLAPIEKMETHLLPLVRWNREPRHVR